MDAISIGSLGGLEIDLGGFDDIETGCCRIVKFESGILCLFLDAEEF
jgi:hypothetical protein